MATAFAGGSLDDFKLWSREIRDHRIRQALKPPAIRVFDGDWVFRGQATNILPGGKAEINDFADGSITFDLPISREDRRKYFLAYWILKQYERKESVHVTVDKNGGRIGGFLVDAVLKRDPKGDYVSCTFAEDIAELRNVHVAANPFLPLWLIQFPRIFFLWCSSMYGMKLALMLNLMRLQLTNFNLGGDPLSPGGPAGTSGFWAQSQIVVKPMHLAADISPTTIITAAMDSWFDVAEPVMEDAELFLERRRFLTGDPEPWPGAGTSFRNGTLIVDIVDKSGFRTGTSLGGNLLTGLTRMFASTAGNSSEDTYSLFEGTPNPAGYQVANWLGTYPDMPFVIYRDGDITGIETYDFRIIQGGPCRITVGGSSMPGTNEIIKAGVNYLGDVVGDNLVIAGYGVGSLGSSINTFLEPIYKDTILSYMSLPLLGRAARQGWGHRLETTGTGAVQAYTPAALIALRTRRRETDPDTAFNVSVRDAGPWLIGDRGKGHWWLGDRVGATSRYDPQKVYVNRCRGLVIPLEMSGSIEATFGAPRTKQDPLDRMLKLIGKAMSGLQGLGIMG